MLPLGVVVICQALHRPKIGDLRFRVPACLAAGVHEPAAVLLVVQFVLVVQAIVQHTNVLGHTWDDVR
jgi:hypothetical protein